MKREPTYSPRIIEIGPTDSDNVCFVGHFGSRFSRPSGPILTQLGRHREHPTAYRDSAVCWAWVANLIVLHNFKVVALRIKHGTLALLDQQ